MENCVLVVDDDAIREFVSRALESEGYTVRTAGNGADALKILTMFPECLILLDIKMPVMDGLEFMQSYCQQEGCSPIIVFSAHMRETEQMACANDFLSKPFDLEKLLNLVEKYMLSQSR